MTAPRTSSAIGIDLGTSTTVAAIGGRVLELLAQGGWLLPSVVAFPPNGATLVGAAARRRRAIDPRNTIVSSKRVIGRAFRSADVATYARAYPIELVERPDGGVAFATRRGPVEPVEIATALLASAVRQAARDPAELEAVIAVPVVFRDPQRQATLQAARAAGFGAARVLDEPLATPLAHLRQPGAPRGLVATYDFGGGTFDFAVLDTSRDPIQVLATGGDLYLGGDDLDRALASWAADEVLRRHRWDLRTDAAVFARLVVECEDAKIRSAGGGEARVELSQVDPGAPVAGESVLVPSDVLDRCALELVQRTFLICDDVLGRCRLRAADLAEVFCAGGTMKLPCVLDAAAGYFGRSPRCDFDPMEVVAIGASLAPG